MTGIEQEMIETERSSIDAAHRSEVLAGDRFEFGKNWSSFLKVLDEERIQTAEASLKAILETDDLHGISFLDIGSGSGLFSLAARRLGAEVTSFDFDSNSVACAKELRRRYFPEDRSWRIEQGSALDDDYMESLGKFDIVYTWGVLHHTGDMWRGIRNAANNVKSGGAIVIAIYNDTGSQTRRWRWVKKTYCKLPRPIQPLFAIAAVAPEEAKRVVACTVRGRPGDYLRHWRQYRNVRGMNRWHDIIDWVGGYPYEVATADEIFEFFKGEGFTLRKLKTGGAGLGCNEFVFQRVK